MLTTQTVQGTVHVVLSLKHGVRLEQESNATAHKPPEPEPSARHWQSELVEQGGALVPHVEGWHCEVADIGPV